MNFSLRAHLFTTIEDLGGCCPVQGYGVIRFRGECHRFYFRARGERWSFGVGATEEIAVRVGMGLQEGFRRYEPWGDAPFDAGHMPTQEAEAIIYRCAEELLSELGAKE